ncbi:MAG: cyclopropane-fatty-acyl-phospholipid synthase family protein [Gemmatimonadota bacterium]
MKKTLLSLLHALHQHLPDSAFDVRFWDGDVVHVGSGAPQFTLTFKTEGAARRIFRDGTLGFGEEYMSGNIEVEGDLRALLRFGFDPAFRNLKLSLSNKLKVLGGFLRFRQTQDKALVNISAGYDHGNEFYKLFLDQSMTYTCAYFKTDEDTIEQAQNQKHDHICRKLQLKRGDRLVDIGCGFGAMMFYAAEHYGAIVEGCTLSHKQYEHIREQIALRKLESQVTVHFLDYRNMQGSFDKFVSIGMIEHVGREFHSAYFQKVAALLKPGGVGVLHMVGKDARIPSDLWLKRYLFPGLECPFIGDIFGEMGKVGFIPVDMENLRLHYSRTLNLWARKFEANLEKIRALGGDGGQIVYDEPFIRMWRFYLNACMLGLTYGTDRLYQTTFTNGINNTYPITRDHLYRA